MNKEAHRVVFVIFFSDYLGGNISWVARLALEKVTKPWQAYGPLLPWLLLTGFQGCCIFSQIKSSQVRGLPYMTK